jgi:predicted phosphodiesterase
MSFWWPSMEYSIDYDLRNWGTLIQTIQTTPHGVFWPLLGARRSGKTWALQAIATALGPDLAARVSLDQIDASKRKLPVNAHNRKFLLFDEPGCLLFHDSPPEQVEAEGRKINHATAKKLVAWCQELKHAGVIVTLALTPSEWHVLCKVGGSRVSNKDLEYHRLRPLSPAQAQKFPRTPEQRRLFDLLPVIWRRNPFLLAEMFRYVFDGDEQEHHIKRATDDFCAVETEVIEELNHGKYDYLYQVLHDCLCPEHREALRDVARGREINKQHGHMLLHLGLLMRSDTNEYEIGDPVLADHFPPPLRIHHISDLHFGPKTAETVDAKDKSAIGRTLVKAAGQGPVRDDYLDWLEQLPVSARPHLLIASGDIAEHAKLDELKQGRAWLERVAKLLAPHPRLAPTDPRVLLVQGNHDVDWGADEREHHKQFCAVFEPTGWPFPRLDVAPGDREAAHWHSRRLGVGVALLGSPEYGGATHEHYGRIDPGLVHDRDIQQLRNADWTDQPVRIAVVHHPLTQNPSIATEVAPYSGLTNAGQLQAKLEEQKFTLLLHGHTHAAYLEKKGEMLIAGAGTLGSRETYERHGFNEILVTREGDHYDVAVQIYERKAGSFTPGEAQREVFEESAKFVPQTTLT